MDEEPVRRLVTVVTSDLKGSTGLGERLDPESLREVLTRYFDDMRAVLEAHGGTIEKIIGDAIIAVFGLPSASDDAPIRAVAAAAATQGALATLNDVLDREWGVRLATRTGVATGDVVVGEASAGQHVLTGPALQLATAMEQAAPAMEVLVHESTAAAVGTAAILEAVEPFTPRGMTSEVTAFRLVGVDSAVAASAVAGTEGGVGSGVTRESRKTVTIVFADPRARSTIGTAPTPEAMREVMSTYFEAMRTILESHGATVEKFIGDAVMAVFGLPVRHEDDGLRAARAALDMQAAMPALDERFVADWNVTLRSHIGVNTGEVVAGDASLGQRLVTGDAVNVAARLEQAAGPREVLIGDLTYRLVRDDVEAEAVEPLMLKGKAEPVPAYRLLATRTRRDSGRREDAPMVGREVETAILRSTFADVLAAAHPHAITVVGEAGVGKTRLTREFLDEAAESATVLRGRCLPYGDGITFWPLIEVLQEAAGIRDEDDPDSACAKVVAVVEGDQEIADRVTSIMGLSTDSYQVGELFWGIRRFFELTAARRPLVVLFDDIHWAEATFLDLIDHLVASDEMRLVVLCTARGELLEQQAARSEGPRSTRIVLRPLSEADSARIIENLLGQAGLALDAQARIVSAAEGNPLFVEQLLSMLIDNGRLRRGHDGWVATADLSDIAIPPTIHALLAARLDALPGDERSIVEPASVIGLAFPEDALEALAPDELRDDVGARLEALASRELVHPPTDPTDEERIHRFHHILIRDAAYQGLLKRSRAVLHERFVEWADVVNARRGRTTEFEEILGYHLEQAYRYRIDLGPLDEHGVGLGLRAAERLGSAGSRAIERGDMPAAASLLGRAASVLPADHPMRPWLLVRTGEARVELGEFAAAAALLDEAIESARAMGEPALEAIGQIELLRLRYSTDAAGSDAGVAAQVRALLPVLEDAGEEAGLARAWRLLTYIEMGATRWGAAEQTAAAMLDHARTSGDRSMEIRGLPALAFTARLGPLPVPEALARCEDLLARAEGDRRAEAIILRASAHLRAMQGDIATAREIYHGVRATLVDLGWNFDAALVSIDSGPIELLAGDPGAAEIELRNDYAALNRIEERNYITTTAAYLAEALYRLERYDEASGFAEFSERVAAADDVFTQVLWRGVRAKLLARAGDLNAAIAMATEGVGLAHTSDDPIAQGNVLVDLALVHAIGGDVTAGSVALEEGLTRFAAKGSARSAVVARSSFEGAVTQPRGTGRIGYTPTTIGDLGSSESS